MFEPILRWKGVDIYSQLMWVFFVMADKELVNQAFSTKLHNGFPIMSERRFFASMSGSVVGGE